MRALSIAALLLVPAFAGCLGNVFGGAVDPYDYLRDDKYTEWVIEIDYAQGHRPSSEAVSLLKARMESLANKDSITVRVDDALQLPDRAWDANAIRGLQREHQDAKTGGTQVVTWVVYLNGHSAADNDDRRVLGVAIGHEVVAIFDASIDESSNLFVTSTQIERAVLVHEFGHIIGLVDNGIPMVTAHSDGGHHSNNQNSVMHASVRTDAVTRVFSGGPPTQFDANDRRDVCNAGGRC